MILFKIAFVVGLVALIVALARIANNSRGGGRPKGGPRRSWWVAAWNASGAKPIETTRAGEAFAVLTGRAAGGTGRAGKRLAVKVGPWVGRKARGAGQGVGRRGANTGRRAAAAAARRWEDRAEHRPRLWSRIRPERDDPVIAPSSDTPDNTPETPAPAPTTGETVTPIPQNTPDPSTGGGSPGGGGMTGQATPGAPSPVDWAALCARVSNFEPENDAALLEFMAGEMAGMLGYAQALVSAHETCVNSVGLAPEAVQGIADFSVSASEGAAAMARAHRRFLVVYREVMAAVANGVRMPYRGRFFTGAR